MSFSDNFPNASAFVDDEFVYSSIPDELNDLVVGLVCMAARKESSDRPIKKACDHIVTFIPCAPSSNWGADWLIEDLKKFLQKLSNKPLSKYMDFLEWLANDFSEEITRDDLNEILEDASLGYRLKSSRHGGWVLAKDVPELVPPPLVEIEQTLGDICSQACSHIQQAISQLNKVNNDRAIKDALRDTLSAMESVIQKISGESKFEEAVKYLQSHGYGDKAIIRDGLTIWNHIHQTYGDVRHGNPNATTLTVAEAHYWIERIVAYISFLSKKVS